LSATKSTDDDKRGFYDVMVKPEPNVRNLIFRNFDNRFSKNYKK